MARKPTYKELEQKIKELDEKDTKVAAYEKEKAAAREQRLREFVERMKKEGKILPKEEAGILSYLTPLSVLEDQKPLEEAMKRIESESKRVDLDEKSRTPEQKYEVNAEASPAGEVDRLARQYIADGKAKDYDAAVKMVQTSHPELWKSYLAKR